MTQEKFNSIVTNQLTKIEDLLLSKGKEYAPSVDRLAAFKHAADLQQTTTEVALGGMLAKHIVSIYQMIPDAYLYTGEKWDEKINDAINYLLLLRACIAESEGEE